MNFADKVLYHQIHPLKLATDILASLESLYFFWQHKLFIGLILISTAYRSWIGYCRRWMADWRRQSLKTIASAPMGWGWAQCPLLAQSRHGLLRCTCLLSGV